MKSSLSQSRYTNKLVITKLDVLSGLEEIKICTGYKDAQGEKVAIFPDSAAYYKELQPIYEVFSGWKEDITAVRTFEDLPQNAQNYLSFIEKQLELSIAIISVGPDRSQNIIRD